MIINKFFILCLFLSSSFTFAVEGLFDSSQIEVEGRTYSNSCSYYSNRSADLVIRYKNQDLPWGTTVKLIYGWGGFEYEWADSGAQKKFISWSDMWSYDMPASEAFVWTAIINEKQLHTRGSPRFLDKLEFVVLVRLPNGNQVYEKGSVTPFGYYEVNLGLSAKCISNSAEKPDFQALGLARVKK